MNTHSTILFDPVNQQNIWLKKIIFIYLYLGPVAWFTIVWLKYLSCISFLD